MFRWLHGAYWKKGVHATDEQLLLFLDGELIHRQAEAVRSHLESCWSCRVRRQKMESAIAGFVESDQMLLGSHTPPKGWREFDTRLDQLIAEDSRRGGVFPFSILRLSWKGSLAVSAVGLLAAASYLVTSRSFAPTSLPSPVRGAATGLVASAPAVTAPTGSTSAVTAGEVRKGDVAEVSSSAILVKSIEIEYALHRLRACVGGEMQVVRRAERIDVTGLAGSIDRRTQILAALSAAGLPQWVHISIALPPSFQTPIERALLGSDDRDQIDSAVVLAEPRVRDYLERTLPSHSAPDHATISGFSSTILTEASAAMREAWALRRLVENYGDAAEAGQAGWLLETMVRDHLEQILRHVSRSNSAVAPVFGVTPPVGGSASASWQAASAAIFAETEKYERLASALFGGDVLPDAVVRTEQAVLQLRLARPDALAEALLSTGSAIERDVETAQGRLAAAFSQRPGGRESRTVRD